MINCRPDQGRASDQTESSPTEGSPMFDDNSSINPGSGNVFADLGLSDADDRLLKARIAVVVIEALNRLGLPQKAAADRLGVAQPDVSNLLRGRLRGYSLERLLGF